jgi:hypothetical protein
MYDNKNINKSLSKLENISLELSEVFTLVSNSGIEMDYKHFTKSAKSLTKLIESLKKSLKMAKI